MKFYNFVILLVLCLVQNISTASWQDDVKNNYYQKIMTTTKNTNERIWDNAMRRNTPTARGCAEQGGEELKKIYDRGYNDITNCVNSASNQNIANNCVQQIDSRVYNEGINIFNLASACIRR